MSGSGRLFLVCSTLLLFVDLARGEGNYQRTRDRKTLVWNDQPKAGDVATWSGARDRRGYARGFGTLIWYTKEPGFAKPQLYARYWGNMVEGKFTGPVNVHSKKKTHHALFADGTRVTSWAPGRAQSRMNSKQIALLAKSNSSAGVQVGEPEPQAPAAGPTDETSEVSDQRLEERMSIQDLRSEHWPKIDIDDSLRLLVWPPRTLRSR